MTTLPVDRYAARKAAGDAADLVSGLREPHENAVSAECDAARLDQALRDLCARCPRVAFLATQVPAMCCSSLYTRAEMNKLVDVVLTDILNEENMENDLHWHPSSTVEDISRRMVEVNWNATRHRRNRARLNQAGENVRHALRMMPDWRGVPTPNVEMKLSRLEPGDPSGFAVTPAVEPSTPPKEQINNRDADESDAGESEAERADAEHVHAETKTERRGFLPPGNSLADFRYRGTGR